MIKTSQTLKGLKQASDARLLYEQLEENRKRNLLILIEDHLRRESFTDIADMLAKTCGMAQSGLIVADNIDLLDIVKDYEAYCEIKHGKVPKLVSRSTSKGSPTKSPQKPASAPIPKRNLIFRANKVPEQPLPEVDRTLNMISGTRLSRPADAMPTASIIEDDAPVLLKPMAIGGALSSNMVERAELVRIIERDIVVHKPMCQWSDIAGLEVSKRLLKEAVIFPLQYPELFTGILQPWRGVLLYGQPGCGKTMLAKAVATECKSTFFNISASSIVSKWRGDSEKLVRVLFEMARNYAPSTIFLDELDSIMSTRAIEGEHEGSRRMKTELLIQMDGLSRDNGGVFVLAASNMPWDLDPAMLRRLEKRIHIDLPDEHTVESMLREWLPSNLTDKFGHKMVAENVEYARIAKNLAGTYSGSDVNSICKEAAMIPLRGIFAKLECGNDEALKRDLITTIIIEEAISKIKPSCDNVLRNKYTDWTQKFGSS